MDTIMIRGLRVYAYHGVKDEEKRKGQPFILDIDVCADMTAACESDNIQDAINYSDVTKCAVAPMLAEKNDLIERAAERVAQAILAAFPAEEVTVTLKKPRAPVGADFEYMAVSVTRRRAV